MAELKIVIGCKEKSYSKGLNDDESSLFLNKKMGEKVEGGNFGFPGYEMEITGGSDKAGFPMRYDLRGIHRKKILSIKGQGLKVVGRGIRKRKTVVGNTIGQHIAQVNLKVLKEGKDSLAKILGKEEKVEEKKEVKEE
ncbi:30S ribosomal protein S6e [Candidatus Woesearchaeota archaeon]|nr:30S ribosomal protein S6e [Candidatus Woesearchaeota archaeon]